MTVIETLANAKIGDTVWLFDSQQNNYVDGKYMGRGKWTEAVISDETRASFIITRLKYDRKTGHERPRSGFSSTSFIYGQIERENKLWRGYSGKIGDAVSRCGDIEKLKQIATLIGWTAP